MDKSLKDLLKEQMQSKGLTAERIKQQTGIAERYLNAFLLGRHEHLPPAPYVRGYLIKLAQALELSGQELWENYKNELAVKISGPADKLPGNRFAIKRISRSRIIAGLITALIVVYAGFNYNRFLGRPEIKITSPSSETLVTTASAINLAGAADPNAKLLIDGEEIILGSSGQFQKEYTLEPGLNIIEFSVKKLLGKEVKVLRQVIYQP